MQYIKIFLNQTIFKTYITLTYFLTETPDESDPNEKRSTSDGIKPISAVVEMVWLIDYSVWAKYTKTLLPTVTKLNGFSANTRLLTYFAHITTIVSKIIK